jgi:hypothetical protein
LPIFSKWVKLTATLAVLGVNRVVGALSPETIGSNPSANGRTPARLQRGNSTRRKFARARGLVAGRAAACVRSGRAAGGRVVIPIAKPVLGKRKPRPRAGPYSSWVTQGPQVAAFEGEFRSCWRAACLWCVEVHDRTAPSFAGRWGRGRPRGDHGEPFIHRNHQQHTLSRRNPSLRGHRPLHL